MKLLGAARGRSMFFVGLITGMAAMLGEAQQNLPAGTAVVGQFRYSDVDLPVRGMTTCVAVFPDGRLHLEKWSPATQLDVSRSEVFETNLSPESMSALSTILAAADFRQLRRIDEGTVRQGQIIGGAVPRPEGTQLFLLMGPAGSAEQAASPLPRAVNPLVTWIRSTAKEVSKQRTSLVKDGKAVNCWIGDIRATAEAQKKAEALRAKQSAEDVSKSAGSPPPVKAEVGSALAPANTSDDLVEETPAIFVDLPFEQIVAAVPELRGLAKASDQTELPGLLEKLGDKTGVLFQKLPNLISREEVTQTRGHSRATRQAFEYLILSHRSAEAVTLDEYRMNLQTGGAEQEVTANPAAVTGGAAAMARDMTGRNSQAGNEKPSALPLSQGFANNWVYFYPANRVESRFRYLGRQHVDGHPTVVIAFAQKPKSVRYPGEVRYAGGTLPVYYQGIAWVDESDYRIVRLRTDLLTPLRQVHLRRLTSEISFGETKVPQVSQALWLPHKVVVTSEVGGQDFKEEHFYSKYRLYTVKSKIVLEP